MPLKAFVIKKLVYATDVAHAVILDRRMPPQEIYLQPPPEPQKEIGFTT